MVTRPRALGAWTRGAHSAAKKKLSHLMEELGLRARGTHPFDRLETGSPGRGAQEESPIVRAVRRSLDQERPRGASARRDVSE